MADWKSSDPLVELIGMKRADIIILRPHQSGVRWWDTGTGQVEMKHGWSIFTTFENRRVLDEWPEGWLWSLAPNSSKTE